MAREKLKKQDLRLKEDEFLTFSLRAEAWLGENYQSIILTVVLCILAIAAVMFFKSRRARVIADNNATYAVAQTYLYNLPYFYGEDQSAQRQQIVAEANSRISTLIEKAGTKPLGRSAMFLKAALHYHLREYDQAMTAASNFLNEAVSDEEKTRGQLLLGYCHESKMYEELMKDEAANLQTAANWREQALNAYQQAAESGSGTYLGYEALLCQARIYDLQKDYDRAIALLDKVQKESNWFDEYSKKFATPEDSTITAASIIRSIEQNQRYTTFQEMAKLYAKRLEGLAAK